MTQTRRIDLNCDLGEAITPEQLDVEAHLMPHVTSVNIACGAHAGDAALMRAHCPNGPSAPVGHRRAPWTPDRESQGRREHALPQHSWRSSLFPKSAH